MPNDRLNIIAVESSKKPSKKISLRENAIERFDKMWRDDPEQFDTSRNAMERERIARTWTLLESRLDLNEKTVADLGCGMGELTAKCAKMGSNVHAVDIAVEALNIIQGQELKNVKTIQDYIPNTMLNDDSYDLVISTEVIAFLNPDQYRLYFSELARLVKREGFVLCSTSVDIHSDDSVQRFAAMAETEFKIDQWILSYHSYSIRLLSILKAPSKFAKAWSDQAYRTHEIAQRSSLSRLWFRINSSYVLGVLWNVLKYLFKPLVHLIEQNRHVLKGLEALCRFLSTDTGISHVMFIGQRRPIIEVPPENEQQQERKHKREVWE